MEWVENQKAMTGSTTTGISSSTFKAGSTTTGMSSSTFKVGNTATKTGNTTAERQEILEYQGLSKKLPVFSQPCYIRNDNFCYRKI